MTHLAIRVILDEHFAVGAVLGWFFIRTAIA